MLGILKRENNYDLLRILSCIAVIMIHISSLYTDNLFINVFGYKYNGSLLSISIYNCISRFAVPCFMMLSGAFLLDNNANTDLKFFYKKEFKNILKPLIIFTFIYICERIITTSYHILVNDIDCIRLLYPLNGLIVGRPYYHLWYLYILMGIYLIIPFVMIIKERLSEEVFKRASIIFFIWGIISLWTSQHLLYWDIGSCFGYFGYFLIGYLIKKYNSNKSKITSYFSIISGFVVLILLGFIRYLSFIYNNSMIDEICKSMEGFNPIVAIASILIFYGFSKLEVKKDFSKLASCTFYIYLVHALFIECFRYFIKYCLKFVPEGWYSIPIGVFVVFILSLIVVLIIRKLRKKIN